MKQCSFPLRIQNDERDRAKRIAKSLGISENRLYNDLIHDGLLMREQAQYLEQLRGLAESTPVEQALAILDKVPDGPPGLNDQY